MEFTILLVDDEKIDLEWLRRRVEGSPRPLRVAGTVNSGFAALDILQREPIDIILSDIRMPIMSGMEFARKAKEIRPQVKIVFISGHEDFSYAQEAIRLNAAGYLLKPIDDGELDAMLEELCAAVGRERERSRSVTEALTLAGRELLLRWLNGGSWGQSEQVDEHLRRVLSPLGPTGLAAVLLEIDDLEWKTREMPQEERQKLTGNMMRYLEDYAAANGLGILVEDLAGPRRVLIAPGPEARIVPLLEELIRAVGSAFPLTITAGSGPFVGDWRQLPESYGQAHAALAAKWLLGKNRLIRDAADRQPVHADLPHFDETVDRMLNAILSYDLVEIDDCLLLLFAQETSPSGKDEVYNRIIRITSKLHADLQQMDENLYALLSWESHQPAVLFQFETVNDVLSWLRRRFFELSELLFMKRRRQNRKLIEEIMRFVDEHLEEKVTLKETAAHFDFTPNYLGHLFKEETGRHFSEYLIEQRMKRVCELLRDPTLKIYEIADRVGYKNILYFNRQFKQEIGMTPSEYRKQSKI